MSKINAKNLIYENTLPPFLARLQATNNLSDGRQKNKIKRSVKLRNHEEEREDQPVYFDEETKDSLTREEWEDREKKDQTEKHEYEHGEAQLFSADNKNETDTVRTATNIATHGQRKKRRAGRLVGAITVDDSSSTEKVNSEINKKSKTGRRSTLKRVKLSFDE
ncbi:hypothetical protein GcC1_048016 [Golovinomyces cichoracearum]|uniref:DUF4604 domain-containing protein n=1 Tax=Golovinomyces cichoracearum TaxID=62708 RepID=A0A420IXJ8_9PEZI|nr:hypothetical protein GcC1_048016 [Golovinomyces cichoracearum]